VLSLRDRRGAALTNPYMQFLANWVRKLSWLEVALSFYTSWQKVFHSVQWLVGCGLQRRVLGPISAIGVDEIAYNRGHKYLTPVYQIEANMVRLLWVGKERAVKSFRGQGKPSDSSTSIVVNSTASIATIFDDRLNSDQAIQPAKRLSRRNELGESVEIDISAAEQDSNSLTPVMKRPGHRGRGREAARGLDNELHARGKKLHAPNEHLIGYRDDVRDQSLNDLKIEHANPIGQCPIRDGLRYGDLNYVSAAQRALPVVAGLGLNADHAAARTECFGGQRCAGQQAAATQRDEQNMQLPHFLEELAGRGALPGDDIRMLERGNEGQAPIARETRGDRLAAFSIPIVKLHPPAVAAGRLDLHRRRILGHDNCGGDAQQLSGERHRLCMVPRREGHHAPLTLVRRKRCYRVESPAEFERPRALQVLTLEEQLRADKGIRDPRPQYGSPMCECPEPARRELYIGVGWQQY
jgi:hypothetical protein